MTCFQTPAARPRGAGEREEPKTVDGQATTGPVRSTFIVDAEGVLKSAQYAVDAKSHVAELRRQVAV